MRFLIDAHLSPGLREVFRNAGHDALHTMDLPQQNASRDGVLNEISVSEQRVVVTKDTDFYFSHLLHGRPWKLVLVRTGNLGLQANVPDSSDRHRGCAANLHVGGTGPEVRDRDCIGNRLGICVGQR